MAKVLDKNTTPGTRLPWTTRWWTRHEHTPRCKPGCGKIQDQHERSFPTSTLAHAWRKKVDGDSFSDVPTVDRSAGKTSFGDAAQAWIMRQPISSRTRDLYLGAYRTHVQPTFGNRSLASVANDRTGVTELLNITMAGMSGTPRTQARMILTGTCDDAVNSGKLTSHKLSGVKFGKREVTEDPDDESKGFVYLTDDQVTGLAERLGLSVWLQRTMGLRICEALGVEKSDFILKRGKRYLHLQWQASRNGRERVPLKHKQAGDYRDIPVPAYVWAMISALPDGPVCPGIRTKYMQYNTVWSRLRSACKTMQINGFNTHSLRHMFATEALDLEGMRYLVTLSKLLGHSDPSVTLKFYVHELPDAEDRVRAMMDARWTKPVLRAA